MKKIIIAVLVAFTASCTSKKETLSKNRIENHLNEAARRSNLTILMNSVLNDVYIEVKTQKGQLSDALIDRVSALSHCLIATKILEGGKLTRYDYSIERATLLIMLVKSGVNDSSLSKIYKKGNFKYSYLNEQDLQGAYLEGIDLTTSKLRNSNLAGAKLKGAKLVNCNLIECNFTNADLTNCNIGRAEIYRCTITNTNFANTDFTNTMALKGDSIHLKVPHVNVCQSLYGKNSKDSVYIFCSNN